MTSEELLKIKKYINGAYPSFKDNDQNDAVWFDLLKDYSFNGIIESVKQYVINGNKFTPSIAEIISGYKVLLTEQNEQILHDMEINGEFDDTSLNSIETFEWNYNNRKRKMKMYLSGECYIPPYYEEIINRYKQNKLLLK